MISGRVVSGCLQAASLSRLLGFRNERHRADPLQHVFISDGLEVENNIDISVVSRIV